MFPELLPVLSNKSPFFLPVDGICSGLVFKFVGSEKISRIWKSLMQVWITGHHGFLREVIAVFVDGSNKAEPYFCFPS